MCKNNFSKKIEVILKSTFAASFILVTDIAIAKATLSNVNTGNSKTTEVTKKKRYADSFFSLTVENKPKTEKELLLILSGLNSLIPIERSPVKKGEMLISKSITLLSLGKHYYLNDKLPTAKQKKEGYLKLSMQAASDAISVPGATDALKAKAYHIYGMAFLYFENETKAVEHFEQSIKLDPNSKLTPRLSVFIGEYYFDREQYEKALPYYNQYINRLVPEELALALYKSAWCYYNLKQFENAEKSFLKIAGKKWAADYGKDAVHDLAQVVVSYKSESEIIQFGASFFVSNQVETLIEFYTNCYMLLLRQSGNLELLALYNEIQRLEQKPEKKVALAIKKLSVHQKGYASTQVFKDVNEIDTLLTHTSIKPESNTFRYFSTDLELELLRAISSYVDTISRKVKTPENIVENELGTKLQKLLWYHVTWFPNSPKVSQTYVLALDNCLFLKDADCSLRISRIILRKENVKNIWTRARVEIVLALETLAVKDSRHQSEFEKELKDFVDNYQKEKEWLSFAKKLTSIYLLAKKYSEVEPYLILILNKENNVENLYRKMLCQYNLKKYLEVVAHLKQLPPNGQYHNEMQTLLRESSLNLAREFNDKNDFNNYEKFLFQYLSLQPEPEKADLVQADYLQKLLNKQDYNKVITYYNKLSGAKKFEGVLSKPLEQLLINFFSMNRFQEAAEILSKGSTLGQYRNFDYYWLRTNIANNGILTAKENKILSTTQPEIRLNILSLAAVSNPKLVFEYFKAHNPINDNEKKVWLISLQMNWGDKSIELSSHEQKYLNSVGGGSLQNSVITKSEKLIKSVEFPQPHWSQARLARVTPEAIEKVKSIRMQIAKDLKGQSSEVQKKLIVNGINVEKKMAWFFDESPVPAGLTKEEIKEYKSQIDSFAIEYYQQVAEYEKMLSILVSKDIEMAKGELPIPNNLEQWSRSTTPSQMLADSEMRKGHSLRALFILDAQKEIGKIKMDEYYRWRSFIVLNQFPHSFASQYLQSELFALKQGTIMSEWSKLVGYSISDRSTASEDRSRK